MSFFPVPRGHLAPRLAYRIFLFWPQPPLALFTLYKPCAFALTLFRFFASFVNH